MQHAENNMDDLFRKAADNYMPDTGNSDWEIIEPQLINNVVDAAPLIKNKRKNKALLLLLLLPLAAGVFSYYFINNANNKLPGNVNYTQQNLQQQNTVTSNLDEKIHQNAGSKTGLKEVNYRQLHLNNKHQQILTASISENKINDDFKIAALPVIDKSMPAILPGAITSNKKIILKDTGINNHQSSASKKINQPTKQKNLYIGIIAGAEVNQVKNQGFKKAGFNAGLLAGYSLNKKISIETGIEYKKKYYFSNGKYFNMKQTTSMPAGMKVISLKGCSNVLEIPLMIKYNIVQLNTSAVFTAAGISSYILIKENNNYNASLNGVQQNLNGLYKHVSTGFASSVNVSVGYALNAGKQSRIRMQPYLQIPIKGMGVGNMQVMSAGINIAVTHSFH